MGHNSSNTLADIDTSLNPVLLGSATTLEPHAANNSAARSAMRSSFMTQKLVLRGATQRKIVTGAERQYGQYTMRVEVPCDARVLRILQKYPRNVGMYTFKKNSETTVIYENVETGEVGSLTIPNFHWNHKVFGFEYKINPLVKRLQSGTFLKKGTVLADSHSVQENGDYWYGIEVNTAFMSVPGIIEDGIVISRSLAEEKLISKGYASKVIEWGSNNFPLNLYGGDNDYRYFADIGERVRDDGILFALRDYDPILAVCNMSVEALQHVDHTFDKVVYISPSSVDSTSMPIIEDVSVWHTHNSDLWRTPPGMEAQVRRYHEASKIYSTAIYEAYDNELRRRNKNIILTNDFHAKLVRCCINDNNIGKLKLPKSVARTFRRSKLDDWRVEVKYSWDIKTTNQMKVSDMHGGKGVVVSIWPDEAMPVDDNGIRADMIVDGSGTNRRMNYGRFNEQYINAVTHHIWQTIVGLSSQGKQKEATDILFEYYRIIAPLMYEKSLEILPTETDKINHMLEVIQEGVTLWIPQNTPGIGSENIRKLIDRFPLPMTHVTYTDDCGRRVRTVKPVCIGSLYTIALEKIGDDWGATSIPKRQHHGIPGKLTDADKSSLPWRNQAFKVFGESEVRLMMGTMDPEFVASIINFPNNPAMCMDVANSILTAPQPTNIFMAADYAKYASIPGRASQYFNHILNVTGIEIIRGEEDE